MKPTPAHHPTRSDAVADIIAYHDRTKHHPERYARGPGGLDWATQPNPFRQFIGAPVVRLPLAGADDTPAAAALFGAEAAGLRGTGIGCYFDDVLHRALGLGGHDWQSLYHFTVGSPIEDPRLRTAPPYAPLAGDPP